jgi:hypothetical protein
VNFRVPLTRIDIGGVNLENSLDKNKYWFLLTRIGIGVVNLENSLDKNRYYWCEL